MAHHTLLRLRSESTKAGGIPEHEAAIAALEPMAQAPADELSGPAIPTIYRFGGQRLALYGMLAQFSTVADETLDDLKVELFFPADTQSAATLRAMAGN